jgi:fructokinase
MGFGTRHGCRSCQGDGRDTYGRRDCSARLSRGNGAARATLSRHADRLARELAHVVNIIDPDVLVLGGGLSNLSYLYEQLPQLMGPHIFADRASVVIKAPRWGDASGSRGAARLWDLPISQQ